MYESLEQAKLFHSANTSNWSGEALAEYKHEIKNIIDAKQPKTITDRDWETISLVLMIHT